MSLAAVKMPQEEDVKARGTATPKILVVDDDRDMCELAEAGLKSRGYDVAWRLSPAEALARLDAEDYSVMLVDIHMAEGSGIELCRTVVARRPDLPVIVMTGFGTMEHAVEAIRAGAYDFVTKPVAMDALSLVVERALRYRGMTDELQRLRQRASDTEQLPSVVGGSDAMRHVADIIGRVADSDTSVLVTGESGTGKELVARALHAQSGRRGPFLAINCAAMPETLLESELFGHVRGAFTDARSSRAGLFAEAHNGTLFLDEIGEMPLGMQAKLLRALQERKVRPVGANQEVSFDARIITATNRDLEQEVKERRFREDLFYRINVVRVDVPALRRRGNDVLELAQFFLTRAAKRANKPIKSLDRSVAERIMSYDWPGNVRELENCMERAVALARFDALTLDDLPAKVRDHRETEVFTDSTDPHDLPNMDTVEQRYIQKVLSSVKGNKTLAAKILGFDRRTLYRKLKQLE